MKIFKSFTFYFTLLMVFLMIMAIKQQINDRKEYYTKIEIVYSNDTKEIYKEEGCPQVSLDEGNLKVGGLVIRSYVKKFNYKVYKTN